MATATNQDQLNEVTNELIRRVQDALLAALGTINIGAEQRIGLLAAIDSLSSAPIGDLQALLTRLTLQNVAGRGVVGGSGNLMAIGAFGVGNDAVTVSSNLNDELIVGSHWSWDSSSTLNYPDIINTTRGGGITLGGAFSNRQMQLAFGNAGTFKGEMAYRINGTEGFGPWKKIYDQQNILGTVSQSSGLPTGAIFERDSNSDGNYVKYADGTMECTTTLQSGAIDVQLGSLYYSSAPPVWNFPRPFATDTQPVVTGSIGAANGISVNADTSNRVSTGAVYCYSRSVLTSRTVFLRATGRWY